MTSATAGHSCLMASGVGRRQGRHATPARAHAGRSGGAGNHHQQVGAEAVDLLLHCGVGALADAHHGDDRGDADDDAEHGQRRAQLVAPQRAQRRAHGHAQELHVLDVPARRLAACALRLLHVRHDLPVAEGEDALGVGGDVRLVGHQHDRDALIALRRWTMSRISSLVRVSRLPVGSSASSSAGLIHQRARDGDALLLAAGELAGQVVLAAAQADGGERVARPLALLAQRHVAVEQRQLDVLDGAGARKQVEVLEDEAELAVADRGALVGRQRRHVGAVEPIGAARRPVETAEDVHERRLARARRAHDGDELAGRDVDGHAAQRLHRDVAELVDLPDVAHLDERRLAHASPEAPPAGEARRLRGASRCSPRRKATASWSPGRS